MTVAIRGEVRMLGHGPCEARLGPVAGAVPGGHQLGGAVDQGDAAVAQVGQVVHA
ncbi:hypothetical protein [Nonomuraea sp. NPDC049480]|uniref:hypothetical protein n=1 Tax=Nonomuraea sp. NPDC049480 TaxID=3364353 RepID=UPI0037AA434D